MNKEEEILKEPLHELIDRGTFLKIVGILAVILIVSIFIIIPPSKAETIITDNYISTNTMHGIQAYFDTTGLSSSSAAIYIDSSQSGQPRDMVATNYYDGAYSGSILLRHARGTTSSPSAILEGDSVGAVAFAGYDGASFKEHQGIIQAWASENWNTTSTGTDITIQTTANGTTTNANVFKQFIVTESGSVGIAKFNGTWRPDPDYHLVIENTANQNAISFTDTANIHMDVKTGSGSTSLKVGQALPDRGDIGWNMWWNGSSWYQDDLDMNSWMISFTNTTMDFEHIAPGSTSAKIHMKLNGDGNMTLPIDGSGISMNSPDGTTYCFSIADGGTTSVTAGSCS